jgi:glycogen debranching enzyme
VPSCGPGEPGWDPHRYWRGPMWVNTAWMVADGFRRAGRHELAARIAAATQGAVDAAVAAEGPDGFAEYYDARTGAALGGRRFTWTAALRVWGMAGPGEAATTADA